MTRSTCSGRPGATGSAAGARQLGRADEAGVAAEHGAHDPRLRSVAAARELTAEGLAGRPDELLVGRTDAAPDDEEARVEGRGEVGQPDAQPLADVGEQLARGRVTLAGGLGDEGAGQRAGVATETGEQVCDDGRPGLDHGAGL